MITILSLATTYDPITGEANGRQAEIEISSGATTYALSVGISLQGDAQAELDAREAELWAIAQAGGRPADLYAVIPERVIKAVVLVILDEINILRQRAGLALRNAGQIDDAIKAKLRDMG